MLRFGLMSFTPRMKLPPMPPRFRRGTWGRRAALAVSALVLAGGLAVLLEAAVRARLDPAGERGAVRVYARPLVLEPGLRISERALSAHLDRLGYEEVRRGGVETGEYRRDWRGVTIGRRAFRHAGAVDPGGAVRVEFDRRDRITDLRDGDGRLAAVTLDPELLTLLGPGADEDRVPVPLAAVPDVLVQAVLTIEDQRFRRHAGIDLRRIAGAALANLRAGRVTQGASTVTQQLARNRFLHAHRTPLRKLREAAMAVVLELRHSKDEILQAYLNEIYLGQDGGREIRGVGRAAPYWFGKDVARLEPAEAALLAGMIRGPNLYHPLRHAARAKARRDLVLRLMHERGLLDEAALERALRVRLPRTVHPAPRRTGRYFADWVRPQLDLRALRGAAVFTTLDARLQRAAEDAVRRELDRLEREAPYLRQGKEPLQAALVAVNAHTGEILAMVGGRDYGGSQFNRAVAARRQPGSAFKPVVALTALTPGRTGAPFTLASVLEDEPLRVETPAGVWEPVNYDGDYRGPVTLRTALERSLNVPFARLGLAVGPARIVATARTLGIESPLRPYPAIALGAFEVTPLEMARAFGVLAAGGWRAEPQGVLGTLDAAGRGARAMTPAGEQVVDPAVAYLVTSGLVGAAQRGTGRALLQYGRWGAVAAKSGTSSEFRDAWFIGYTPGVSVAVWVGFDDGRSVGLPGSRAALPIFARFLQAAADPDTLPAFPMPEAIEIVEVDPATGLRGGWGCRGEAEVFLQGTAPTEYCAGQRWTRWADDLERQLRRRAEQLRREVARVEEAIRRRFGGQER